MVYSDKLTKEYETLKREAPGCLLIMQVGAFMRVMDEDAHIVAEACGLKLSVTGEVDRPHVIGGFPKSGLDKYIGRLVRGGHSVAVAFQDGEKRRRIADIIRVESKGGKSHGEV